MTFNEARKALSRLYDERESNEILLRLSEHLTHLSRSLLLCDRDRAIAACQNEFDSAVRRLLSSEPLQYVLGYELFRSRRFSVSPFVLIPRPETEDLVSWVEDDFLDFSLTPSPCFADIATGSGCIAISLALDLFGTRPEHSDAHVLAVDISSDALSVAQANATALRADVSFLQSDFLSEQRSNNVLTTIEHLSPSAPVVLVSNPPYVTESEKTSIHPAVLDHEPHLALFVPDSDPLLFYRALGILASKLSRFNALYVEVNQRFADDTAALFRSLGFSDVCLRHDRFSRPRMLRVRP